ncbi:MAG TPA: glycerophosphodiester phosphodiesterase [Spirochaetia bacterium]|nr:glycerophosphodiester phosphodiesterase [Spirochaetia bacterium]
MARPLVLAHRGVHTVHPENSLDAFRAAFASDADGIECDVQKTKEGVYVIVHDPPSADNPAQPARLSVMLASLPAGAFLNLELKSDTLGTADCAEIFEALRARANPGPLLVSSFEPRLLAYFKARGVPIGLLIGEEAADLGMVGMAREIIRLKPDYLNLPILMFEILGRRRGYLLAAFFKILGFSLAFWTVKKEEVRLVLRLARIIITDDVRGVRERL